jgi:broad specificity phosphatase PhoE
MNFGKVRTFTGLNSFFEDHYDREEILRKLIHKLQGLDKTDRVLMVTHQVVISAITGINVGSGVAVSYSSWSGSAHKISMK